jgi:sugar lactone lactonase YvrE
VSPRLRAAAAFFLCTSVFTCAAFASATTAWEMTSYQDFIRGQFQGVSLSRDGRLTLAPKVDTLFSSGQSVVWSVAEGAHGVLYVATGHRGRIYQVDPAGSSSLLWTADQPEVFAVTTDRNGVLYAGTSPDGKVYRIDVDKSSGKAKASEYFNPKSRYIWSLASGADGALYIGTGDQGKIYRVTSAGTGEVYYDTGQSHITGLALDAQGRLLAGTEPNGILYRVTAKDKAFVLYDASLPEIRAILPQPDGTVYAAALGGSLAKRAQAAAQAAQSGAGTPTTVQGAPQTVTVEAQNTQPGAELKPQADPTKQTQPAPTPQVTTQFTAAPDLAGVERSAIYRINPDNTVETLWSSKEEDVYDILALPNQLLFSTDGNGRIYGLSRDRKITLVLQTNEGEATRLLPSSGSVLVATGDMGRIYRLGDGPGASGSYESPVHDAGTASRWGSLSWRAETAPSSTLIFRTRSGNSAKPDKTWSDWSEPLHDSPASRIASPNARYIQWKAEFAGAAGITPILDNVTLAYLPQNSPPIVRSINVTLQMAQSSAGKNIQQAISPYTVTVTDSGDASASAPAGTPTQTLSRAAAQQITISWQAEDPDGDRLVYNLYFRADDERRWMLLKGDLHENAFTFDSDVLADGKYYFRVLASDREVNPPATARDADLTSAPVMIDNTPPVVTVGPARRTGTTAEVQFDARDAASPLRRCEYSLDATGWVPLEAVDGVIDSQQEKFVLSLDKLTPGEHLVVIRVLDSANNAGLAKVVLR